MLRTRIIPCLLLKGNSLVKTVKFDRFEYIGDPMNTCRIFNELEVDEMAILDIRASKEKKEINFSLLEVLVSECFMPLSYGGGIQDASHAEKLFSMGFEKIILNSILFSKPELIQDISKVYGCQSIIVAIDVRKSFLKGYEVYSHSGTQRQNIPLMEWVKKVESLGAGEILLTSIDREGTWKGFDLDMVKMVSNAVKIPVIAHGGAGCISHIQEVVKEGHASAVGLGSMVVFQNKGMGVLVNFPDKRQLAGL
ncbi:MAG: imidazole glycerol phosphate synthase subunit HisF [Candidatus Brocadiae bacterium]|nr:imidazole glycerol phosphate synthase subunit HisF [Candidatus Brocadiia bacterium]